LALLLVVIVAAGWLARAALLKGHAHYDNAIETRLDQIARYERIAATRPAYEKAIVDVLAKDAGKYFLKTQPPALAAADLQQFVQGIFEANALRVESVVIAAHKDQDFHRRITLKVSVRGKLSGVLRAFHSIESARPYLFLDSINLQGTVRSNYVPIPLVEPDVTASFDIHGYSLLKK
jgi:hypothetical protein